VPETVPTPVPPSGGAGVVIVIAAGALLAAGLAARLIAGRRLRRDASER